MGTNVRISAAVLCVAALMANASCVKTTTIRSTSQRATPDIPVALIRSPYVPAHTRFTVQLAASIDSRTSHINDAFEGFLTAPLRDANGVVIAEAGNHVIGRVAQTQSGRYPMIDLVFDGIRTNNGFHALSVNVYDAMRTYYNGPEREVMPPMGPDYGTAVYVNTFGAPFSEARGDVNGGITTPESYFGHPRDVRLERGATLTLELTRPLVL